MHRPTGLIRGVVLAVTIIYSLMFFVLGIDLPAWWRYVGAVFPMAAVSLLFVWDLWLWRFPAIIKIVRRPDLRGLWAVTLTPHKDSHIPEGGNWGPVKAYMEFRQTFWTVHLKLYSPQSSSHSIAFNWIKTPENEADSLIYSYAVEPKVSESDLITRNIGAGKLFPSSLKPEEITGLYFTDRPTKGDIKIEFVDRTCGFPSFEKADEYAQMIQNKPQKKSWFRLVK